MLKDKILLQLNIIGFSLLGAMMCIALILGGLYFFYPRMIDNNLIYQINLAQVPENDTIANLIVYKCQNISSEIHKIYCVHNIFVAFYDYTEHDDKKIRSPTKTLLDGGVCRDAAILFCSIYNRLDLDCEFQTTEEHVFNVVKSKHSSDYCIVDQYNIDCKTFD